MSEITMEQIVAELKKLEREQADGPPGFTTEDWAVAAGKSQKWVRERLRALIRDGKVVYAGKRTGLSIENKTIWVPVYQLAKGR